MEKEIGTIFEGIVNGDMDLVRTNVAQALEKDIAPREILNSGLIAAMDEVGSLFEKGEFFVPEMLVAARAMKSGLEILKPKLAEAKVEAKGTVVIGTVKGDLHDIGKNLVAIMLEGAGFKILDLGVDTPPERFVTAVQEENVDILALSALLTTTMTVMEETVAALEGAGLRDKVKVIVGGAPVTQNYADSIGVDGFAPDASAAVTVAKSLLN